MLISQSGYRGHFEQGFGAKKELLGSIENV